MDGKKTKFVYVVKCDEGQYEDYHEWIEAITEDEELAKQIARKVDESHFSEPPIDMKAWYKAENRWYDEHGEDPDEQGPCKYVDDPYRYNAWLTDYNARSEAFEKECMMQYLRELGVECDSDTYDVQRLYADERYRDYGYASVTRYPVVDSLTEWLGGTTRLTGERVFDGFKATMDDETYPQKRVRNWYDDEEDNLDD